MKMKLQTTCDADTFLTVDTNQVLEDYPELNTHRGHATVRIDDHSLGSHSVAQVDLNPTEAHAVGKALCAWARRQPPDEPNVWVAAGMPAARRDEPAEGGKEAE